MHLSKRIKQTACAVLSAALLLTGCSTPAVAATVDGKEYSTGVYLAYLYMMYQQTFQNTSLSLYAQYGMDPWEQKLTYGEGDDAEELYAEDYIIRLTKDTIVRQKALENKLKEYGLTIDAEELANVEKQIAQIKNDDIIQMGFNRDSYGEMLKAYSLNERALFYGLYDKGGERAMSDEDIRAYFEKNYLSYKIIEISLTDSSSGADLSDEKIKEVKEQLQGYLDLYNETGDFDKAIAKYTEDKNASTTTTTSGTGATTSASNAGTATAAVTTTTEAAASATTGSETGAATTTTTSADSKDEDDEEDKDPNLKNIDANTYGDEKFTDAVKSVAVGEAKIVEYKKNDTTNTAALILRLDPEEVNKDSEDGETYFEQNRENIISGAKYEEFDKEIKEYAATLDVKFDAGVVKKCTPRRMEEDAAK